MFSSPKNMRPTLTLTKTKTMNYKPIDWSKPVQTKDGQKVHIFCTDAKLPQLPQPVVGHIEGTNYVTTWDLDGHWTSHDSKNDLINVPTYNP